MRPASGVNRIRPQCGPRPQRIPWRRPLGEAPNSRVDSAFGVQLAARHSFECPLRTHTAGSATFQHRDHLAGLAASRGVPESMVGWGASSPAWPRSSRELPPTRRRAFVAQRSWLGRPGFLGMNAPSEPLRLVATFAVRRTAEWLEIIVINPALRRLRFRICSKGHPRVDSGRNARHTGAMF
jgi:hypothetical protein